MNKKTAEGLSYFEKKVLLALKELGKASPEHIQKHGNFNQLVEVMNAASWLQSKGLVTISDTVKTFYRLGKEGEKYLEKKLPEERALLAIPKGKTQLSVEDLNNAGLDKEEITIAIKWFKEQKAVWKEGVLSFDEFILDEIKKNINRQMAILQKIRERREISVDEINPEVLDILKKRQNVIKSKDVVFRKICLTELGKQTVAEKFELTEEISQLTPELLQTGKWREATLRKYDINTFAPSIYGGKLHPFSQIINEIRKIMLEMGFTEVEYDFIQPAFWNMDALFVPQDHPARDMQDSFYIEGKAEIAKSLVEKIKVIHEKGGHTGSEGWLCKWDEEEALKLVLRTHNTVNTIRFLSEHPNPPVKVFSIGRDFRREGITYKHLPEFVQIDGILMEESANLRMLIGILKEFALKLGFEKTHIIPSYFPFTEPSLEVIIEHEGKQLEIGGAGIFRPEVVAPYNIKYPVLAWGLGIDRLALLKYGLEGIRELYIADLEMLRRRKLI